MAEIVEKIMELLQLENGDIVLRDSESKDEPLMTLSFSEELEKMVQGAKLDIAKVMLEAGIRRHQEILFASEQEQTKQSDGGLLH